MARKPETLTLHLLHRKAPNSEEYVQYGTAHISNSVSGRTRFLSYLQETPRGKATIIVPEGYTFPPEEPKLILRKGPFRKKGL